MVNFFNKKIIVVSIFIVGILNAENIEGRWIPGGFNNTMYEFVDTEPFAEAGLRYTYYCTDDNGCDSTYWNSLDTGDAIPNPNPYWVDGNTLIIDLFFGNQATYTIGFRCDGQVVDFYYDEDDDWEGLHSSMFRLSFDDFNNDCLDPNPDDCLCTEEWDPVCGIDGNTYSNACFATCEYVVIAYEGECVDDEGPPECIMDCGGCIEEDCEDDIEFCNWLVTLPGDECIEDCDEEILEEINEYVAECEECLADPENCGDEDNVTVDYNSGWNLVGLPLNVEDSAYSILYPESTEGTLYSFSGAYNPATNLINGEGYWLRFNESGSTTIYGTPIYELTINLNEGWNLISGLYEDISISSVIDPDGIITPGTLYGFSGSYVEADVLVSGNGYWLRAYQDGEVSLIVDGGPPEGVSYGSDIQPIFDDNCISCHINGGGYFGGLDLSTYENLMSGNSNNGPVVTVGDGANSYIIQKLEGTGGGAQMPQGGSPLPSEQINLISQWIDEGALNSRDNSSKDRNNIIQSANVLNINGFELFFGLELSSRERLSYSLPPKPPSGAFDVRFKDGWRHVKDFGAIELMPTSETLTISYDIRVPAGTQKYWTLSTLEGEEFILENTGVIEVPSVDRFTLERKSNVPETFTLHQNFPNPFNPITTLSYDLPKDSNVRLTIFDMLGNEVNTLVNSNQQAGFKSVQWNATDPMGRPVSAGVYLYKIQAGEFVQTKKMVLLK